MAGVVNKTKRVVRSRGKRKATAMPNAEIWKKILADQQLIRELRRKGVSYEELRDKYGFKFATI
jgi:hypothetical protein